MFTCPAPPFEARFRSHLGVTPKDRYAGIGTSQHLGGELFKVMAGVEFQQVPYRGSTGVLPDLLAGHLNMFFGNITNVLPLIREGKMRALGVSSIKPVPAAPEIAPLAQAGVPGYDAGGWLMFAAPAATPKEIVAKLHSELKAITATPDIQQRFTTMGLVPIDSPPVENLQRYVVSEIDRWGKVIRAAGIEASQ